MSWSKVTKPSTNIWTLVTVPSNVPVSGFDFSEFDVSTFDQTDTTVWTTKVAKPSTNIWSPVTKPT